MQVCILVGGAVDFGGVFSAWMLIRDLGGRRRVGTKQNMGGLQTTGFLVENYSRGLSETISRRRLCSYAAVRPGLPIFPSIIFVSLCCWQVRSGREVLGGSVSTISTEYLHTSVEWFRPKAARRNLPRSLLPQPLEICDGNLSRAHRPCRSKPPCSLANSISQDSRRSFLQDRAAPLCHPSIFKYDSKTIPPPHTIILVILSHPQRIHDDRVSLPLQIHHLELIVYLAMPRHQLLLSQRHLGRCHRRQTDPAAL